MSAVGQVLVLHGVGALLSRFLGGWLADRSGRRATMAGGLAATAASTVGLAYAHQLLAITAAGDGVNSPPAGGGTARGRPGQ